MLDNFGVILSLLVDRQDKAFIIFSQVFSFPEIIVIKHCSLLFGTVLALSNSVLCQFH